MTNTQHPTLTAQIDAHHDGYYAQSRGVSDLTFDPAQPFEASTLTRWLNEGQVIFDDEAGDDARQMDVTAYIFPPYGDPSISWMPETFIFRISATATYCQGVFSDVTITDFNAPGASVGEGGSARNPSTWRADLATAYQMSMNGDAEGAQELWEKRQA